MTMQRDRERPFGVRGGGRGGRLAAALLALTLAVGLGACDDESLMRPDAEAGETFDRYVALGNSLTAGFQSSGINDSTQRQSFAVLLAEKMGTEFNIPALNPPGCPAPLVNVFTGERVGGAGPGDCALRETPVPDFLSNVAVPGAEVVDALMTVGPETNANALTTLLLGGRTQLQAAAEVRPTFASVWLGNNDALAAALAGNPALLTPPEDFASRFGTVLDSLQGVSADRGLDAVLIGVADVTVIPFLSPGAAYWQAEQQGAFPPTFDVEDNCAPAQLGGAGESTLVPFSLGFGVLLNLASAGVPVSLDCQDNRPIEEQVGPENVPDQFEGVSILTGPEIQQIAGTVAAYNDAIQTQASERGFAYFNPNPTFAALRAQGQIPLFPNAPPSPDAVEEPFGPLFSRDGVHPSAATHRLVADSVASAINQQLDTSLPVGG